MSAIGHSYNRIADISMNVSKIVVPSWLALLDWPQAIHCRLPPNKRSGGQQSSGQLSALAPRVGSS